MTIKAKMFVYGFFPFGGIHSITFVKVDSKNFGALTNEHNAIVKLWNHKMFLKKIDNNSIEYTDEIEVYAGIWTKFIALWAKSLYKHRQKRWQLVLDELKTKSPSLVYRYF